MFKVVQLMIPVAKSLNVMICQLENGCCLVTMMAIKKDYS